MNQNRKLQSRYFPSRESMRPSRSGCGKVFIPSSTCFKTEETQRCSQKGVYPPARCVFLGLAAK